MAFTSRDGSEESIEHGGMEEAFLDFGDRRATLLFFFQLLPTHSGFTPAHSPLTHGLTGDP